MKQIAIISGKGGTGKTVLTASFAFLAKNKVMVDCDVDAADLHLLLHPVIKESHEFSGGVTARIDPEICVQCGKCIEVCRFDAISDDFVVDPISCEGCKLCSYMCHFEAINMEDNRSGDWFVSDTKYGTLVHAKLGIAEENSGKLVTKVRQVAKEIAEKENQDYIIIDGPPGIGCPVIASLTDVNTAIIVTEPTVSGVHDMQRVLEIASYFKVDTKVVINKYDLNVDKSEEIKLICKEQDIEVAGMVPFSREVSESIVNAQPIVEYTNSDVSKEIISIWQKVCCN
jgi:MinD superfamily P-loop ATPase